MKSKNIRKFSKDNWSILTVLIWLTISAIYLLFRRENVIVQVHDNLDNMIPLYKVLKDNRLFWKYGETAPILGDLDRNYLQPDLKLYSLLYMLFPCYTAYMLGNLGRVLISVVSCVLLAWKAMPESYGKRKNWVVLCGFIYGLLPFYPAQVFSFASLPLLVYLLYGIYEEKGKMAGYYLAIFLYPLLSDFVLFGIFLCGYLLLFIIYDSIIHKKVKVRLVAALLLLSLGYVVTEHRIFYMMLLAPEASLRVSMETDYLTFGEALATSVVSFGIGYYHCSYLIHFFIFFFFLLFWVYKNYQYIRARQWKEMRQDLFNLLMVWQIFNALLYGFDYYLPFVQLKEAIFPFLKGFSIARALWLNPFLIMIQFFLLLLYLKENKRGRILYFTCVASLLVIFTAYDVYNDISANVRREIKQLAGYEEERLTYEEFYAEELFEDIKESIHYQGEKSVAFGFHPAVLYYNGIHTLDGYLSWFSQGYKEEFRRLIAPALERNEEKRDYYDGWGGRAYIYPVAGTYEPVRVMPYEEEDIYFDSDVFAEMSGKYVFSRVKISNAEEMNLELQGVYQNEKTPYVIYVYCLGE